MAIYREVPDASSLLIAARLSQGQMAANRQQEGYAHAATTGAPSIQPIQQPESWQDVNGHDALEQHYGQHQQHQAVGFWHEHLSKVRAHVFLLWARTVWIILCFVMAVLALYWGVLFEGENNLRNLVVHVVDFDGQVAPYDGVAPLVGPALTEMAQTEVGTIRKKSLGYTILPPSQFNNSPIAVRQAVYNFDSWAAIIINSNATALLQDAVTYGNASYDPTGAVQVITLSARDDNTYSYHVLPQLQSFMHDFTAEFGRVWIGNIMTNISINSNVLARAPAAVNPAVAPLFIDLRPFGPPTVVPTVSVGLIYLTMIAFSSFTFFSPLHNKYINPQGHPPLHFWQFIVWRWCATVLAYVLISLVYSIVPLAFKIPFWPPPASPVDVAVNATAYGPSSFVVFWALNFLGMCALGLASENVSMVVGQPWTALWLLFWVITNMASAFYSLDLASKFFRWGYAWPMHNMVEGTRQILFNLRSRIGLNFGLLLAWTIINTILFPFCCRFMRWKAAYDERVAEREADRYVVTSLTTYQEGTPNRPGTKASKKG